ASFRCMPTSPTRNSPAAASRSALSAPATDGMTDNPAESTLRSQIAELTDALRPSGRGLVVTVDEVQSAALEELRKIGRTLQSAPLEELRKLGGILQYARHEDSMLAFAGAGLSTPIEELLDHPGATFLRRAEHHTIGPVSRSDVRTALAQTIADGDREIDVHAL